MKQLASAHQASFERYTKKTRREQFLEEMNVVMPWPIYSHRSSRITRRTKRVASR